MKLCLRKICIAILQLVFFLPQLVQLLRGDRGVWVWVGVSVSSTVQLPNMAVKTALPFLYRAHGLTVLTLFLDTCGENMLQQPPLAAHH